jgi:hypothetical protein
MSYPQFSIIIPAYNEASRITQALESVVHCVRSRGWFAEVTRRRRLSANLPQRRPR